MSPEAGSEPLRVDVYFGLADLDGEYTGSSRPPFCFIVNSEAQPLVELYEPLRVGGGHGDMVYADCSHGPLSRLIWPNHTNPVQRCQKLLP